MTEGDQRKSLGENPGGMKFIQDNLVALLVVVGFIVLAVLIETTPGRPPQNLEFIGETGADGITVYKPDNSSSFCPGDVVLYRLTSLVRRPEDVVLTRDIRRVKDGVAKDLAPFYRALIPGSVVDGHRSFLVPDLAPGDYLLLVSSGDPRPGGRYEVLFSIKNSCR